MMKKGFTLAEVLITLGVVGIVAVLTVPAVVKNYRNRLYTAQLEKVSAQIADAIASEMNDEHTDNFYETKAAGECSEEDTDNCTTGPEYLLNNYLKSIKKDCLDSDEPCATASGSTYTTLDGDTMSKGFTKDSGDDLYCIQTTNGAAVCANYNSTKTCMSLAVDVNAMAEPNITGRDIFAMDVHSDGTLSDYNSSCIDGNDGCDPSLCTDGSNAVTTVRTAACGCYSKVRNAGWKMDY